MQQYHQGVLDEGEATRNTRGNAHSRGGVKKAEKGGAERRAACLSCRADTRVSAPHSAPGDPGFSAPHLWLVQFHNLERSSSTNPQAFRTQLSRCWVQLLSPST
jgi:hypothetical protein